MNELGGRLVEEIKGYLMVPRFPPTHGGTSEKMAKNDICVNFMGCLYEVLRRTTKRSMNELGGRLVEEIKGYLVVPRFPPTHGGTSEKMAKNDICGHF
jgi:hypothetical protein